MGKYFGTMLLALGFSAALVAQTAQPGPAVGTWKLNVAKSKFSPGPAPKSVTVNISEEGKVSVDEVTPEGKEMSYSMNPSEGTAVPVTGMEGTTFSEKKIDDRTFEHTWTTGNTTMHGKAVISADGKTMRYTMTGTRPDGKTVHNSELYDKQ